MRFDIDPDIRRARTLPSRCYTDPAIHELCVERILARSWQIVPCAPPAEAGAVPFRFLPGSVAEPLLLTRDRDGGLHCVSNVCTHRGALLAACPTDKLRCPYHGRRFGLDGRFAAMPGFEEAHDFPTASDDLPQLPLVELGPFRMTALDPAVDFDTLFGPLREWFDAELHRDPSRDRTYTVEANWMLYLENFLEGFHIPFVHPDLHRELGDAPYEIELFDAGSVQLAYDKHERDRVIARYAFAFPNLMFNFYPWGLSLNIARPTGPTSTEVEFQAWVKDPTLLDRGASQDLDLVQREDELVVESMQDGMRSRLYDRGRYAPRHETAVHQFHRLIAKAIGDDA